MKKECATNKMSMKEVLKSRDKYLWKKVDVQVKKEKEDDVDTNIHKSFNVTTMKSTSDKEKEDDVDIRRNIKDDVKLKKDMMSWKKEKNKYYKHKKRRKSSIKRWRIKSEDTKFK